MDLYNLVVSAKITKGGGGGDISVDPLSVTENGTYTADEGHAYSPVTVDVPGIVPSGTSSISENGIYDITNFASVDVNVSGGGGDHDAEDEIIQRTLSGKYINSRITVAGSCAFYGNSLLTELVLPEMRSAFDSAFAHCSSLETVNFATVPSLTLPNLFTATPIKTFIAPCATIPSSVYKAFSNTLEYWDTHQVFFANLGMSNLKTFIIHSASTLNIMKGELFPLLSCAKFYDTSRMGKNYQFSGCSLLTELWLHYSGVVSGTPGMLTDTPMADSSYTGSFGSIYVPASLISDYKAAEHWSVFSDRITAYEGE